MLEARLVITLPLNVASGALDAGISKGKNLLSQGKDAKDALVDVLAQMLLQALFQKKGDGATFDDKGGNPLMDMIAKFMDQNAGKYNSPHDATGSVKNWQDEVKEDNYLDSRELSDFTKGLKDALRSALFGGFDDRGSALGGGMSQGGLGGGFGGMSQGGLGGGFGGMSQGGLGGGFGGMSQGGLGGGFGGMSQGGLGGGFGGAGFGSSPFGGPSDGTALSTNDMSPMGRSGFSMGGDFASHVGKTAVDGIDIRERSGRFSFGSKDTEIAKDIGKFMDQHTEMFGAQPRGGWANRIDKGKDFNSEEIGRFKQAMESVKDIMDGKSTGDKQVDTDGMLLSNAILHEAMNRVSNGSSNW